MTLNSYLSNAKAGGYAPKVSYGMLLQEFKKGNVSYPRTDGKNHAPLKVLKNSTNSQVRNFINKTPNVKIEDLGDYLYIEGDPFILCEYLKLSTPGNVVRDFTTASHMKYKYESDKYVGIDYKLEEERLSLNKIELEEFNFEDLLREIIADEMKISEEAVEVEISMDLGFA